MAYAEFIAHRPLVTDDRCSVCLESFLPDEEIVFFLCSSNHYFHTKCGEQTIMKFDACPLCRTNFKQDIGQNFFLSMVASPDLSDESHILRIIQPRVQRKQEEALLYW